MSGYDASEWEPGDVASLTIVGRAGTKQVAAMRGKDGWYYPTPSGFASNFDSASTVIDAIDPRKDIDGATAVRFTTFLAKTLSQPHALIEAVP